MKDCENVDWAFQHQYFNTRAEISAAMFARFSAFLTRHNLWDQFLAEDAQGKR